MPETIDASSGLPRVVTDNAAPARWLRLQTALNVLATSLLLLVIVVVGRRLINSDAASVDLLAEELLRSTSLFSKAWIYVSDDLSLDGRTQVAMLATHFWGVSVRAHIFSMLVSAFVCGYGAYALSRTLGASRANAVSAALVILIGPSLLYQDLVLGLMVSMPLGMVLLFVTCVTRFVFARSSTAIASAADLTAAGLLLLVVAASSSMKAIPYMWLPATAALTGLLAARLYHRDQRVLDRPLVHRLLLTLVMMAAAMAGGYMLHRMLSTGLFIGRSYSQLSLDIRLASIERNIKTIVPLFAMFTGKGNTLLSGWNVALASGCLLLIAVLPWLHIRRPEFVTGARGFVALYAAVATLAIFGYLLTYESIKKFYGVYYLILTFSPMVCVAASTPQTGASPVLRKPLQGALLVLLTLGVVNSFYYLVSWPRDYFGMSINAFTTSREQEQLSAWLQTQRIGFGFAPYWDANAITLRSDAWVRTISFQILPGEDQIRRHGWLVAHPWLDHRPQAAERWFIALPLRRRLRPLPKGCLPANQELTVGAYTVYLYRGPRDNCFFDTARKG